MGSEYIALECGENRTNAGVFAIGKACPSEEGKKVRSPRIWDEMRCDDMMRYDSHVTV